MDAAMDKLMNNIDNLEKQNIQKQKEIKEIKKIDVELMQKDEEKNFKKINYYQIQIIF